MLEQKKEFDLGEKVLSWTVQEVRKWKFIRLSNKKIQKQGKGNFSTRSFSSQKMGWEDGKKAEEKLNDGADKKKKKNPSVSNQAWTVLEKRKQCLVRVKHKSFQQKNVPMFFSCGYAHM